MNIGYFPLLSAFSVVCFLPAWFWDTPMLHLHHAPFSPATGSAPGGFDLVLRRHRVQTFQRIVASPGLDQPCGTIAVY